MKRRLMRLVAILIALLLPSSASAGTITVSAGGDGAGCTLRNAIVSANTNTNTGGCVAGDLPYGSDTIQVPGSVSSPIQLGSALSISVGPSNNLTINGPGATALDVRGGASFRVLNVDGAGATLISNLTISHGNTADFGGGISIIQGDLTLDHAVVSQNSSSKTGPCAVAGAGAIYSSTTGTIRVLDSTVSSNSATATATTACGGLPFTSAGAFGGAILNDAGGTIEIVRSTISGNTATATASFGSASGGGIAQGSILPGGTTTIKNSTLSGNQALGSGIARGGAIAAEASSGGAVLQSDTITNNKAASGANVFTGGNTTTFKSTIVSAPQGGPNCSITSPGANVSGGYNLEDANTCGLSLGTDQPSTPAGLVPSLADNGGPTLTHALLPDSAAIDQGFSFGETLDQRSLARTADFSGIENADAGGGADVGAFESQLDCDGQATPGATCPEPNEAPVCAADSNSVDEDNALSDSVSCTDADGDTLTYSVTQAPVHGSLTTFNGATGGFTYTPDADYNGPDSFKFSANDGTADSNEATFSITVNPVDDPDVEPDREGVHTCGGRRATIVGTESGETLKGSNAADVIVGLGGNDVILGLGGNDLLCGGAGGDRLLGGRGRDTLLGQAGRDILRGGPGRDKLRGGPGRDRQFQ